MSSMKRKLLIKYLNYLILSVILEVDITNHLTMNVLLMYICIVSETTQTCQTQTLNITCGLGEQIIVTAARFGRMEASSRCITGDYQTGCSENVIGLMDKHCSGWRTCEMLVPNDQLPSNACSIDLQKYLEVTYQCVRGECS